MKMHETGAARVLRRLLLLAAYVTALSLGTQGLAGTRTATLTWDENDDPTVVGTYVYYWQLPGGATNRIKVDSLTNVCDVPSLTENATYAFYVTAYNASDLESVPSNVITFTPISNPINQGVVSRGFRTLTQDLPLEVRYLGNLTGGSLTNTPDGFEFMAQQTGNYRFSYSIDEGRDERTRAFVSIDVVPGEVNLGPVVTPKLFVAVNSQVILEPDLFGYDPEREPINPPSFLEWPDDVSEMSGTNFGKFLFSPTEATTRVWRVEVSDPWGGSTTADIEVQVLSSAAVRSRPLFPRFTPLPEGRLTLDWQAVLGQQYFVEAADDLNAPSWTPTATVIASTSAGSLVTSTGDAPHRFFRITPVP